MCNRGLDNLGPGYGGYGTDFMRDFMLTRKVIGKIDCYNLSLG